MTKILRIKMVQTLIVSQMLSAKDDTPVGPLSDEMLAEVQKGADDDAAASLQPGMEMEQQIVSAEVIEI